MDEARGARIFSIWRAAGAVRDNGFCHEKSISP
jgi:hypothetical protein